MKVCKTCGSRNIYNDKCMNCGSVDITEVTIKKEGKICQM